VYTVLPFCFSCGEVHRVLDAASLLADWKELTKFAPGVKTSLGWFAILENALLEKTTTGPSPQDWFVVWTEDAKFKAAGGAKNLIEILETFIYG
jgi:hypothetical protein